jgi:hypothetical protein
MKLDNLHQRLITAARAEQPSERVPYAFEKARHGAYHQQQRC